MQKFQFVAGKVWGRHAPTRTRWQCRCIAEVSSRRGTAFSRYVTESTTGNRVNIENAYAAGALPLKPKKPPVRGPFKPHPGGNFSVFACLPAAHQNGQYGLLGVQTVLGLFKDLIGVALEGLHRDLLALAWAWRVRPSSVASHCFFSFMPISSAAW